jgi:hypothetical protein
VFAQLRFGALVEQQEVFDALGMGRLVGKELPHHQHRRNNQDCQREKEILIPPQELHGAYLSHTLHPRNEFQAAFPVERGINAAILKRNVSSLSAFSPNVASGRRPVGRREFRHSPTGSPPVSARFSESA